MADDDREARAREAVRRAKRNAPWLFSKEGNRGWYRHHLEMEHPKLLVEAAKEGDAEALEFLRDYARGARRAGMWVPSELHQFVWDYFIDGQPKAPRGSGAKDSSLRNLTIALLVKMVSRDYGFPEYCNSEWRGAEDGPMTACRLVGEEIGLAERTVEDIWADRKASVERPG